MTSLPDQIIRMLKDRVSFDFNEAEGVNDCPVETTLDDQGLHVYGSKESVVEFLLTLGYTVGYNDASGIRLSMMIDLTEGLSLNLSGRDDVDVQLPKFLVDKKHFAPDAA